MRTYYGKSCAVPPALKSRELICPSIALAADLDGTFAVARMQPVSRGCRSLQSWRPVRGAAFHAGRLASTAAWAGLA